MEAWRGTGDGLGWRPPLSTKLSAGWHCGMGRGRAKGRSPVAFELRPDERSRCAEHLGEIVTRFPRCAHLTGGSHDLTTDDAAQQEVLSFARIATTLLQERLPWVTILL